MTEKALIDKKKLLERWEVKGGWTYISLPEIPKDPRQHFGMRKVRGTIDGHELPVCNLMPVKGSHMMLPVNATIRKKIKKEAGATVHLILFAAGENIMDVATQDFIDCLHDEPAALAAYNTMSPAEQKKCLQWLMEITVTDTRIQRMADAINHLAAGRTYLGNKK
ncbi:Bacteriocin-protection, YdeI or OmpD-Associated [Chitinophaga jiangningensis]|uniref:Bacteriocin-protection, YdeI or OmpD-Associated n=1 Tax=Chitinophaga jiangningensis TaxID=1419482 RepID=A0A1M7CIG3_9BACT|nr:YdeI/OmpD-associated family protein [Chitinophaga jiangningensis]SHL66963.1 Bacteriocin-protection, YdeI or OmpD-Associated [Chitinophaga jiangningensis]